MKKGSAKIFAEPFLLLFLLAVFFLKIPSLYLLPFLSNSPFLTTQSLARVFLILIFFFFLYQKFKLGLVFSKKEQFSFALILLFFAAQSLSILPAINISAFLLRYKDIFLGIISLFIFRFYRKEWKKIILVFILASFFNIIYQALLLMLPSLGRELVNIFIYKNHADLVLADLGRDRLYTDTYDEIIIPLLFLPFTRRILSNFVSGLWGFLIGIISFLSNFRSRLLMLFIGFFASLIILIRVNLKRLLAGAFILLIAGYLAGLTQGYAGFTPFYDRLSFADNGEDFESLVSRVNQIKISLAMGRFSFFGVGLGNFYDYNNSGKTVFQIIPDSKRTEIINAQEYAHNLLATIIAESGYLSFLIFLIIIINFIINDFFSLRKTEDYKKALIIAFWSLFAYGMFNPPIPASYQVLFWGIRGLLL